MKYPHSPPGSKCLFIPLQRATGSKARRGGAVLIGALVCLPALAQSVQLTALVPSAAPGVATAPGTATIMGAAGRGTGTAGLMPPLRTNAKQGPMSSQLTRKRRG